MGLKQTKNGKLHAGAREVYIRLSAIAHGRDTFVDIRHSAVPN